MVPESPEAIVSEEITPEKPPPAPYSTKLERLPLLRHAKGIATPSRLAKRLATVSRRAAVSLGEARQYNSTVSTEDREAFYLAGMNAIARKIWELARLPRPNVHELRIYLELYLKHRELEIKKQKTDVMLRHLELLESKRKLLEEAAKDRGLTDVQFFGRIREVFYPATNGHSPPKQIENGLTS